MSTDPNLQQPILPLHIGKRIACYGLATKALGFLVLSLALSSATLQARDEQFLNLITHVLPLAQSNRFLPKATESPNPSA